MHRLHIIIDNVRSAFNVGSIFRTADATGCAKIYICGISATPDNPKVNKTALSSTLTVEWEYFYKTEEAIEKLKSQDIPVYAIEVEDNSEHFQTIKFPNPVGLILGNEIDGVKSDILKMSDKIIHIPMQGMKESLNVATAAGIIMFEAIRS